jgi:hypothetical protein
MSSAILIGVYHKIDVKALALERRGQSSRIVDRLGQRCIGIRIMTVADDQSDPRRALRNTAVLFSCDWLRSIECALVQRSMSAYRQRDHTCQSSGNGDSDRMARGPILLPYIHRDSLKLSLRRLFAVPAQTHPVTSGFAAVGGSGGRPSQLSERRAWRFHLG